MRLHRRKGIVDSSVAESERPAVLWAHEVAHEKPKLRLNGKTKPGVAKGELRSKPRSSRFLFEWRDAFSSLDDTSLDTGLPPTTRLILWVISGHMDTDGTNAFPGQETIAKKAGLNLRTTKLHLLLAKERGWLRRRPHRTKYGMGYRYSAAIPTEGDSSKPGVAVSRIRNAKKGDS